LWLPPTIVTPEPVVPTLSRMWARGDVAVFPRLPVPQPTPCGGHDDGAFGQSVWWSWSGHNNRRIDSSDRADGVRLSRGPPPTGGGSSHRWRLCYSVTSSRSRVEAPLVPRRTRPWPRNRGGGSGGPSSLLPTPFLLSSEWNNDFIITASSPSSSRETVPTARPTVSTAHHRVFFFFPAVRQGAPRAGSRARRLTPAEARMKPRNA
jgi:hypothetical protein